MMKEYIDRKLIEEMLENAQTISDGEYCGYCTEDIDIDNIPTEDVKENEYAWWKRVEDHMFFWYECSNCGCKPLMNVYEERVFSNYCPYCGAKMDKE